MYLPDFNSDPHDNGDDHPGEKSENSYSANLWEWVEVAYRVWNEAGCNYIVQYHDGFTIILDAHGQFLEISCFGTFVDDD